MTKWSFTVFSSAFCLVGGRRDGKIDAPYFKMKIEKVPLESRQEKKSPIRLKHSQRHKPLNATLSPAAATPSPQGTFDFQPPLSENRRYHIILLCANWLIVRPK